MDIQVGTRPIGRLEFELFADTVPRTAENFRALCTGEHGTSSSGAVLHFKGSKFHRIISGFMAQGGDFTKGDGTGGEPIYGKKFTDENFMHMHDRAGLLSMANAGPNTNGSQFFLTFRDTPHLNGRHVVFGRIVSGIEILKILEMVAVDSNDRPRAGVTIADCGQLGIVEEGAVSASSTRESVTAGAGKSNSSDGQESSNAAALEEMPDVNNSKGEEDHADQAGEEAEEEINIEEQTAGMSDMQKRLFLIRMKMNKGRKENKAAVDEEYKKVADPNYFKKQKSAEWIEKKRKWSNDMKSVGIDESQSYMLETAASAERKMEKADDKERNVATFGWQAFTAEADYRAYKKRLAKLPTSSGGPAADGAHDVDELQYGKIGTAVSAEGLRRIHADVEEREKQRLKFSRRRNEMDASMGGINDKNEVFNKKIGRAFDKYTVEIRQNLERGTAL